MPYRSEQFVRGEIYHIVLRGIDDNLIFKDIDDYYRGIFSVYEFNNSQSTEIRERRRARALFKKAHKKVSGDPISANDKRERLVDVLSFCFMPNHIHLLLKQLKGDGITKFMQKVGVGYGGYFNRKYNRKGYVFQNRFLAVHIKDDNQLKTVFVYIHTNPTAIVEPGWKEKGIKNPKKTIKFLEDYKWSSYQDYIGKNNFPSVTERGFLLEIMGGSNGCQNAVIDWIKYKKGIKGFNKSVLE